MPGVVPGAWSGARCLEWCPVPGVVPGAGSGARCLEWCLRRLSGLHSKLRGSTLHPVKMLPSERLINKVDKHDLLSCFWIGLKLVINIFFMISLLETCTSVVSSSPTDEP